MHKFDFSMSKICFKRPSQYCWKPLYSLGDGGVISFFVTLSPRENLFVVCFSSVLGKIDQCWTKQKWAHYGSCLNL